MARKDKSVRRGVELYIDGKEIKKDIASIEREARALTKELRGMTIGTEEYHAKAKRLRELNGVIAEHKAEIRAVRAEQTGALEGMNNWMSKWGGLVATATAGFAALAMAISKSRKELLEREDAKANVKALTGLDDESIDWLEEKAHEFSTTMTEEGIRIRQSATDILGAFRRVGSAKPELLQDKEALVEVTKQSLILAQASGMELKDAVDAVTLSMNQYGASASDAARYANVMAAGSRYGSAAVENITSSVKKAGVAAATAGVSIEELVGAIETLGEKGIKNEIAGTGLKSFFLKLEKQSDDVRPSVVGLQTAMENLAAKGMDAKEMIKTFGLVSYTVAQAMVSSTDKLKHYTDAVSGTNTAVEQASIVSATAAAKLEQLKNKLAENGMILAEMLYPVMSKFMHLTNKFIQMLVVVGKFMKEYGAECVTVGLAIVALTTYTKVLATTKAIWAGLKSAVVAYRTAMILTRDAMIGCSAACTKLNTLMAAQNIVTRLVTGAAILFRAAVAAVTLRTNEANRAMAAFNATIKVNPWAMAVTAIAAIGYAFMKVHQSVDRAVLKMKEYKRISDEAAASTGKEVADIERLNRIVHDNANSYAVRKQAIEDLQKIIPDYHASLTKEGELIDDNIDAINVYCKMLQYQAEIETATSKKLDAEAKKRQWMSDEHNKERATQVALARAAYERQHGAFYVPEAGEKIYSSPEEAAAAMFGITPGVYRSVAAIIDELQGDIKMYDEIIAESQKKMEEAYAKQAEIKAAASDGDNDGDNNDNTTEKETAKQKRVRLALLAVDTEYNKKAADLKQAYIKGEIESEQVYTDKLAEIELARLNAKLQVAELEEAQRADLLDKVASAEVKLRQKLDAMVARQKELSYDEQLDKLLENFKKQEQFVNDAYDMGIIPTIEKKEEYLLRITENYRVQKKAILDKQAADAEKEAEKERKAAEDAAKARQEAYEKEAQKIRSMAEEISDIFEEVGDNLGEALFGENKRKAWKELGKDFLKDALSIVEKYILIKQAQVMADAIASASTIAGAAPAIAKAALKMAAIKAAFGLARGAVNSFDTGGFTGSGRWNEPKGVVHSNEFVANRFATANPNVLPVLSLIDAAQKSGSISHLTGDDIAAVAGRYHRPGTKASSSAPSAVVDNSALIAMLARVERTMQKAQQAYERPAMAYVNVKGKGGIEEAEDLAAVMVKNASR